MPLILSLRSLQKSNLWPLVLASVGISISCVVIAATFFFNVTDHLVALEIGWLDSLINWLVGGLSGIVGWFLLPTLIPLISSFFQGTVLSRMLKHEYPESQKTIDLPLKDSIQAGVQLTLKMLSLNLLIVPSYLMGIGFVLSFMINSYLLGREFFEMVAHAHASLEQARKLRHQYAFRVYVGGAAITTLSLTPVLNLLVPVLGMVWMCHLYQSLNKTGVV